MTIRTINRLLLTGKPVVAIYAFSPHGPTQQGRIIRARLRQGRREVKTITGAWAVLQMAWDASR